MSFILVVNNNATEKFYEIMSELPPASAGGNSIFLTIKRRLLLSFAVFLLLF